MVLGASNPLIGRFDNGTMSAVHDMLVVASRHQRVRLVNRVGRDMPIQVLDTSFIQLGALLDRLVEEQIRLLCRVRVTPSGIPILIGLDTTLLFRVVGLLLGESPFGEPSAVDKRPLTSTDLRLGRRVLEDFVEGMQNALPEQGKQRLVIEEVTDDPRIELGMPDSSGIFETRLTLGSNDNPFGTATLAVPTSLVPVLWPDQKSATVESRAREGITRVLPLRLDAVAELGRVRMPLSKVRALEVGDTLDLGAIRQVEVTVRGKKTFIGEAGVIDGTRCVRILRRLADVEPS
jgi:flagellar motor switch protein FliM